MCNGDSPTAILILWKGGLGGEEIIENTQAARSGKNKDETLRPLLVRL
jgi:hypothetical protein